jgi:hypothetical protein
MGLSVKDNDILCAVIQCESGFNAECIHRNYSDGRLTSTDWGICQINDYFHIGKGKDFPTIRYVLENPETCVRWMVKQWKRGEAGKRMWICYSKKLYKLP